MPSATRTPVENRLLAVLPAVARSSLLACGAPVELAATTVLCEPGTVISHVYFPFDSLVALVSCTSGDARLDVGLVGNEGMLGTTLMLGVRWTPLQWRVQGAGLALRIEARSFLGALADRPALRRELDRYLYVTLVHLAQNVACQRFHLVEARLACWLLMRRDRTPGDSFHITHENLARTMGVRRAGITRAAGSLQNRGLIHYVRGDLRVVDGPGLEAASCSCYAADRQAYASVMGGPAARQHGAAMPAAAGHTPS